MFEPASTIFNFHITGSLFFAITSFHVSLLATLLVIAVLSFLQKRSKFIEAGLYFIYEFCDDIVVTNTGKSRFITKLIFSIFLIVSISNILGTLIFFPVATEWSFSYSLIAIVFLISIFEGIRRNGLLFPLVIVPKGVPLLMQPLIFFIELISFLLKSVSTATRLFMNITIGHLIVHILHEIFLGFGMYKWLGFPMLCGIMFVECCTGLLQAYIYVYFATMIIGTFREHH